MAPNMCIVCSLRINRRPSVSAPLSFIECNKCKEFCHTACAGLNKEEVEFMNAEKRTWCCKNCDILEKSVRYFSPPNTIESFTNSNVLKALKEINDKLEDQKIQFNDLIFQMENRIKLLEETINQINIVKNENVEMKKNLNNLEIKICNMEQKMRANTLDITGIPYAENEKTDDLVLKVFNSGLNLNVLREDIVDCFRVKANEKTKYSPAIIVKLTSTSIKQQILSQKTKHRTNLCSHKLFNAIKSKPIFINENLCKSRRILLNAALNIKKERDFKFVWTKGGNICMRKEKTSPVQVINCMDDLYDL